MGNLVSLTETKAFMQISNTLSDTLIDTYISIVEAEVNAVTDRTLERATYTETLCYLQSTFDQSDYSYLDANLPTPDFFLKNYPVINGSLAITHNGATVTTSSYTANLSNGVVSIDYYIEEPTATYVAGYTTVTTPADLKGVVMMGVSSLFQNNTAAVQGKGNVQSKSIKDFSVTYGNAQTGLYAQIFAPGGGATLLKTYIAGNQHILNKYRKINV